jgi:ligand-binding SRPBCC domain-containing protein
MVAGAFSRFDHDHHFESCGNGTIMTDVFDFTSPFGPLGRVANWLFVTRHLRGLLATRNKTIKSVAESGDAAKFTQAAENSQRNRSEHTRD